MSVNTTSTPTDLVPTYLQAAFALKTSKTVYEAALRDLDGLDFSIALLRKKGDLQRLEDWLLVAIKFLNTDFGIPDTLQMTKRQQSSCVETILERFFDLTRSDFALLFRKGSSGEYNEKKSESGTFRNLNTEVICTWCERYTERKRIEIAKIKKEKAEQEMQAKIDRVNAMQADPAQATILEKAKADLLAETERLQKEADALEQERTRTLGQIASDALNQQLKQQKNG